MEDWDILNILFDTFQDRDSWGIVDIWEYLDWEVTCDQYHTMEDWDPFHTFWGKLHFVDLLLDHKLDHTMEDWDPLHTAVDT